MGTILAPFKKLFTNKLTITILGVVVGLIVLYIGYNWRINSKINPTRVPYAVKTLNSQEEITEDLIGYTEVPSDTISNMSNLITNIDDINGKLVSFDSTIPKNGFFYQENVIKKEDMPDYVFNNIPDGHTVFNHVVKDDINIANSLWPGENINIDIISKTDEDGEEKVIVSELIQSIKILAIRDSTGKAIVSNNNLTGGKAEVVLFSVPEDLFLLLSKIRLLSEFEIHLRPLNDSFSNSNNATQITQLELKKMIEAKTYKLKNECIEIETCG